MKVISYGRVSTDDKDQDPERQHIANRNYAKLHEHEIVAELTEFHTGDSFILERPEGSKITQIKQAQGLLVFSIDRYSREHPIKVLRQLEHWREQNFKIISITEPVFNMESEFSELLMYILTWVNNWFLKKLKRDIKSGMDRARKEGKQIGRAPIKFNKYRAYHLLFIEKASQRDAAKELGVSAATLNRFKRDAEKNPDLYKKYANVSKTDGFETKEDNHEQN